MSVFKPGDRVVIVHDGEEPENIGAVTTVIGPPERMGYMHPSSERYYSPDDIIYPVDMPAPRGYRAVYKPSEIEPLPPDSHEKADLATMPDWMRRLVEVRERC